MGITIDAYLISISERVARLNYEASKFNRLSLQIKQHQNLIIKQQVNQTKIGGLSSDASEHLYSVTNEGNIIKEIKKQLLNNELNSEQQLNLMKDLNHHFF